MIKKRRFFYDFDREERWLAAMAGQGYEFVSRSFPGIYQFRRSEPEDALIRIDYRTFKSGADFEDYKVLFGDSGWRHIGGSKNSGAQYFKRIHSSAGDDIFSDQASKAGRYRRLSNLYSAMAGALAPLVGALLACGAVKPGALLDPRLFYQTPGLWEKTASDFWSAFLLETPFALLRGLPALALVVVFVFTLVYAARSGITYKRSSGD